MPAYLTSASLDALKQQFLKAFPTVRSSHLTEIIAFGMGYRTSASLRHDIHALADDPPMMYLNRDLTYERLLYFRYDMNFGEFAQAFEQATSSLENDRAEPDATMNVKSPEGPAVVRLNPPISLAELFGRADQRDPAISSDIEGGYRRGYHQAIAAVAHVMKKRGITAERLEAWVNCIGMDWRKEGDLNFRDPPPPL